MKSYPSDMAQNFWTAIFAWTTCFVVTIVVSVLTRPRDEQELMGLVYSMIEKLLEENIAWFKRPAVLAVGAKKAQCA